MIGFDDARNRLLDLPLRTKTSRVELSQADGRVLAEDVTARKPVPAFDYSAMDGYAVRLADGEAALRAGLPVTSEVRAGDRPAPLVPGSAARIFTGAAIPPGADTVVMQEHVERVQGKVAILRVPALGANIRRAGEDLAVGAVALEAGQRVHAGQLALLATLDAADVAVFERPRVAILCTGSELRAPGSDGHPAMIAESVSLALRSMALRAGASVELLGIVRDDESALIHAIEGALERADVLLTVGGVSVGDHDLVPALLAKLDVQLTFRKVAMKPGKPLLVGQRGAQLVLGLPGNPASALVTFGLFGCPLLRRFGGERDVLPLELPARYEGPPRKASDRDEFVRVRLQREGGQLLARPHNTQAAGATTSLAHCDGLARLPPNVATTAGNVVHVVRFSDF